MTYQVLARKWRPQSFAEVVGQQPIVTALGNAIRERRVAQAYLFSGIRGVGKTSVARIFAKALNCEQGPTAEPCGECPSCREIAAGASILDVIEVDAATYSKVEQVRELTESLKYGAARDRYKVVILDEIHRLSRQAFDALLKIVEEPPPHLVFIFATTELENVPATILSRCQEFRFRRVTFDELADHLERVASAESIEVGPTALRLIARASDGSVRDAIALLDQLATFGAGTITDDAAAGVLGGVDSSVLNRLLTAIVAGDAMRVTEVVDGIEQEGWDPRYVFTEFLEYCRSALHLAVGVAPEAIDLPHEEAVALHAVAGDAGYENLLRTVHLLLESEETVRRSESGLLAIEIAWLRAAELPKLVAIEELLASGDGRPSAPSTAPSPRPTESAPRAEPPRQPAPPRPRATPRGQEPAQSRTGRGEVESNGAQTSSQAFLDRISRSNQALAAHLAGAHDLSYDDGELTITVLPGDNWIRDRLRRKKNKETIESALAATWGKGTTWRLAEGEAGADSPPAEGRQSPDPAVDDPRVQTVLDIFGGSVESVEEAD
jgi:DNA polymerase-3 subunit gamma/tau